MKGMGYLEADESDGVFKIPINYSIVTNIDIEHTIIIKLQNLQSSFGQNS